MAESVQASVRPSECLDTYYAGKENNEVQCLPTTVENRFVVALPSLNQGSTSTVTFNPDGGLSDIIVNVTLPIPAIPAGGQAAGEGLGLTRGWLAQLVDRISVRYAGSSLYFFGGEQSLIQILSECEDSVKRDNMLLLAGAEITSPTVWASESLRSASLYLKLPHNSPSAQEKPLPFPTDALSAPVQVQITWKPFASVFLANDTSGASLAAVQATIPTAFASGEVQFKQAHLNDRADSVAVRDDMSKHMLSIPLKSFQQTQFTASLAAQTPSQQAINLTGFRSGSVQNIKVWAIATADLTSVGAKQPLRYLPFKSLELAVNGLVYYRASNFSHQIWDLCDRKASASASMTVLTWNPATDVYDKTAAMMYWAEIPFAQHVETLANEYTLANGLGIANSVVNLVVDTGYANTPMTLYASYSYNATIVATGGSCDYVF